MNLIAIGFLASLIAGLATGVGALPAFFLRRVSMRTMDVLLGGAAGVMLAATSFSLIVPGIDAGNRLWPGWGIWVVVLGMAVGAVFLDRADKWLPHEHFIKGHEGPSSRLRKIWLFIIAITIHNFPEGLATFTAAITDPNLGIAIAVAIAIHNIPEGIAVSVPVYYATGNKKKAESLSPVKTIFTIINTTTS